MAMLENLAPPYMVNTYLPGLESTFLHLAEVCVPACIK